MFRVAICDDMQENIDSVAAIVEEWAFIRRYNVQLRKFISGEDLLAELEMEGDFNIVLLDIELKGGMDGIAIAMKMREMNKPFCLIFISQYEDYYRDVFQAYPFQYLEKPVSPKQLMGTLDVAVRNCVDLNESFIFRFKNLTHNIRLREILYFASDKRVVRIYMENGDVHMFYEKLDELEIRLNHSGFRFLRIHQSYLVNAGQIEQYHKKYVVMRNKQKLPISVEKRNNIMNYHMHMLDEL